MKNLIRTIVLTIVLCAVTSAADVDVRLSSREAYVGSPIVLQIQISNANSFEQPSIPDIDGCEVRAAGAPAQSSQITIINGKRSESRSVTMQYLLIPRREGTFRIPPMSVKVDGKNVGVQEQSFVATTSETGDLLFVDIEGSKEKVFVGEPLELTLKIWIKPFRDTKSGLTLSEGAMWSLLSESTSWGSFADRMNEMAANRQRPGGQEVLRDDGNGSERAYYLYQIHATVYPKRTGKIDASDVQIVVDYPTAVGRSRSPFGSMFDDDSFGGGSVISRMLNDDGFGPSSGGRMAVKATRPIVGEISVDATEVLSVPLEGRPADYRGAVGKYQIVTHANPTTVDAGDPITLNIGIAGNGPMELVQAPPLSEQVDLTKDFKVADDSLAGFVKNDTKVFSTTIRPRQAGKMKIPPIRLSFFDPEIQKFQTVFSEPIEITVNESETLALDAIVSTSPGSSQNGEGRTNDGVLPNFTNCSGEDVLLSQVTQRRVEWWWGFVLVPPIIFLLSLIVKIGTAFIGGLVSSQTEKSKCLSTIKSAGAPETISAAVVAFVLSRGGARKKWSSLSGGAAAGDLSSPIDSSTEREMRETEAIGRLRVAGLYHIANDVESFLVKCHSEDVKSLMRSAVELIQRVDAALHVIPRNMVKTKLQKNAAWNVSTTTRLLVGIVAIASSATVAIAQDNADASAPQSLQLSLSSAKILLAEATEAYNLGMTRQTTDVADAKEAFLSSSKKYQMLVDSGISNWQLYTNLGNAYLQSGELGRAIANYEKALHLEPTNSQAEKNLALADSKVVNNHARENSASNVSTFNRLFLDTVGANSMKVMVAVTSIIFWGLCAVRIFWRAFPVGKYAVVALALLLLSLGSLVLNERGAPTRLNSVIVANDVILHEGDGEQFANVMKMEASQGIRVEQLATRGQWVQIQTEDGKKGWIHARDIEASTVN